jgi:hypothetical protein
MRINFTLEPESQNPPPGQEISSPENSKSSLAPLEVSLNRTLAILLIFATIPFVLNILTIPTIILFVAFSVLLLTSKKYHPTANTIFFIFALGVYFISLPIGWGLYSMLRVIRINGSSGSIVSSLFSIAPLIFVTLAIRNAIGNILTNIKHSVAQKNTIFIVSLIIVLAILLAPPFLSSIKLRARALQDDDGSSKLSYILTKQEMARSGGSTAYSRDYTARFDPISNKYIYRLLLEEPLVEPLQFTAVRTDGERINFSTDNRIGCSNCQKETDNPYAIVFPSGKNIDFIITSEQFIQTINFSQADGKISHFIFWK